MKNYIISSIFWSNVFDIAKKKVELKNLGVEIQKPDFWNNPESAAEIQQKYNIFQEQINLTEDFKKDIMDFREIVGLLDENSEEKAELLEKIRSTDDQIKEQLYKTLLSGKYDKNSAILSIQSGAGGRDAEDWVCLLLRMYQKYCEKKKWSCKIISQDLAEGGGPEGRIGVKEVIMAVNGEFAYGFLKKESGVHRLVRISPFSAKKLRHTSFAKIEVLPQISQDQEFQIRPEDLRIETFRSSGPGGQNVNKRETAVRVIHLPTGLAVSSQSERTQGVNKKNALHILVAKLAYLQEQEREKELNKLKGEKVSAAFGSQIRSYVLHPYKLVKDLRTNFENTNAEGVLNGDLEGFLEAGLRI